MKRWLPLAIAWIAWVSSPAIAAPTATDVLTSTEDISEVRLFNLQQGEHLFQQNCSACHINGQNLIIPYKNLEYSTLKTYKMDSLEAIVRQVQYGKNVMPAFGEALSLEQIQNIAAYVLQQATQGW